MSEAILDASWSSGSERFAVLLMHRGMPISTAKAEVELLAGLLLVLIRARDLRLRAEHEL